jgi:hypothetical protein
VLVPPSPHRNRRPTFGLASIAALVLTGLVTGLALGACSSSPNSSTATTSATTSAPGATTAPTTSGGSGSSTATQLQALSAEVQAGQHATFKAVYSAHPSSGASQTITFEQKPPKTVFSTTSGSVIDTGTTTYFCSATGGQAQCVSEASGANPLESITAIFNPTTLLNEFHAAQAAAATHTAGYSVALSDSTYAGLSAKCLNYSSAAQTVKYCVTDSGILAYAQAGGGTFALTSYSSSPPDSDFSLPAGATIITIPNLSVPSTS